MDARVVAGSERELGNCQPFTLPVPATWHSGQELDARHLDTARCEEMLEANAYRVWNGH
jgi:hypothetical protein